MPKSVEEGLAWYRLAGAHGWPNAITALGDVYRRGRDVPVDYAAALELYEAAASLGQTDAMQNLGRAYFERWGVERDVPRALGWLQRATSLGNPYAPFHLARFWRDAEGTLHDPGRAADLFRLAAERGFAQGWLELGALHEAGALGAFNAGEAYFAYRLAAAGEVEGAGQRLDALAAKMPVSEREQAEARAQNWLRLNGS